MALHPGSGQQQLPDTAWALPCVLDIQQARLFVL
jgi:hypothetical protein